MSPRAREAVLVGLLAAFATLVTMAVAAPVVRSPSWYLFGAPLVGHHHDPFTFMQQISGTLARGVYLQPATDVPAAAAARAAGPVAAYNGTVLLTFPLAAIAAFLLARHLAIGAAWSALAALLFAFSPFHLAHAAYHAHVAQTQWIPLYFLAPWRTVDRPSPGAVSALVLVAAGAAMSNFYGGLIVIVMTPVSLAAYWCCRARPASVRRLVATIGVLVVIAAAGAGYAVKVIGESAAPYASYATAPADLTRYGARWWSYAMPPASHPLIGTLVRQRWHDAGVDVGLLEQQVSLGWGVMGLALVAFRARSETRGTVRVLTAAALVAFVFSLAGGPAVLLRELLPMFRAYARFGVAVQLMAALLAAIGAEHLWRRGTRARMACAALVALAAAEYVVWPPSVSRPVLPTRAHQWAADHPGCVRVLDCAPAGSDTTAIRWLTRNRVTGSGGPLAHCSGPDLPANVAAAGYTHLLVRRGVSGARWAGARTGAGFPPAAHFDDSDVYAVAALAPVVAACEPGR